MSNLDPVITVSPMLHQDEPRIRVDLPYDPALIQKIRSVPGARWSAVQRCWHVPKTVETWQQLRMLFGAIQVTGAAALEPTRDESPRAPLPKTPGSPLAERFAPDKISLFALPGETDLMGLYLPPGLVPEHLATVKNIHGRRWDAELKVWRVPCTKLTVRFLDKYFPGLADWRFPLPADLPERLAEAPAQQRKAAKETIPAGYGEAVVALEQCLTLKWYSWRTVKAYKNCLRQFIRHYDDIKPSQLTRKQLDEYVAGLIREKRISESHQNQILSAIKMFYAEVVGQEEKVQGLFRPKRSEKLPQVLTQEEVARLLKAIDNIKHRCMLILAYSAGLRLGEVLQLKLTDLQPEYQRLFVRQGKGKRIAAPSCRTKHG